MSTNNNLAFRGSTVSRNTAEIDQFPVAKAAFLALLPAIPTWRTDFTRLAELLENAAYTIRLVCQNYGHFMAAKNLPGALNSTYARTSLPTSTTSALIQLPKTNSAAQNSFIDITLALAY